MNQLVIVYDRGTGKTRETIVYATAYDMADANLSRARCVAHHGTACKARILEADTFPPRGGPRP